MKLHQHDYDMKFIGEGLEIYFVCRCGDVAPDMETAIERMMYPTWISTSDTKKQPKIISGKTITMPSLWSRVLERVARFLMIG